MRALLVTLLCSVVVFSCGGNGNNDAFPDPQCSDGIDNDGDGTIDFPDDLGCKSPDDDSENSPTSPKCDDGRDNDGDGKIDYPNDPGCFAPQSDDEIDDCPDGPNCPLCANGVDDDGNGATDYPTDPGCESAGDTTEFTNNPVACGANLKIKPLPATGSDSGTLDGTSTSLVLSECGGGGGAPAVAYVFLLTAPKVIVASTDDTRTTLDTVLNIRSEMCSDPGSDLACNDDAAGGNPNSTLTKSLQPGVHYLIVSGHDSSEQGDYALTVKMFNGEGTACTESNECGPGLLCRMPVNQTTTVCAQPACSDGLDDDGDGKIDYPNDPGCATPDDNDELDTCPGAGCPACADGADNDSDGLTDFPNDPSCISASGTSESCISTEGTTPLLASGTTGDTSTATDDIDLTCSSSITNGGKDLVYALSLPTMQTISINVSSSWDAVWSLLPATCQLPEIQCADFSPGITRTNLAAGNYFLVVDAFGTGSGTFTVNVTGTIANGQRCDMPLAESGALNCSATHACVQVGAEKRCQPSQCSDGIDNNGDGKIDYPDDPGCSSPADPTEDTVCPGASCPVCANGMDDDSDGTTDFVRGAGDFGCQSAGSNTETFCPGEPDVGAPITTFTTTGDLAGKADNYDQTCQANTGNDMVFPLQLPVPVATLVIDTNGSVASDTVVSLKDAQCGNNLVGASPAPACDDDAGDGLQSLLTVSNLAAGNYAIQVDGFSTTNNKAFTLHVKGTVAPQTACTSPLFSGGANAVLQCPTGTTCTAGKCQ